MEPGSTRMGSMKRWIRSRAVSAIWSLPWSAGGPPVGLARRVGPSWTVQSGYRAVTRMRAGRSGRIVTSGNGRTGGPVGASRTARHTMARASTASA